MTEPWNQDVWNNLVADRERATHAWLFCGVDGLGKSDLAIRYSGHLLDEGHAMSSGSHPDFHVLSPEATLDPEGSLLQQYGMRYFMTEESRKPKSVISVDQVRELARIIVNYAYGSTRVVLISPAHLLNINAANALLKNLEEPPAGTVFILVTSRPDRLPATVRSRCSRVDFRVPPRDVALSWLAEKTDDPRREIALDVAGGAPLLALSHLESGFLEVREAVIRDIRSALNDRADITAIPGRWKEYGADGPLRVFQSILADLAKSALVGHPPGLSNPDCLDWLQQTSKSINLNGALALSERIGAYLRDSNSPLDKSLVVEDFFLDLVNLGRT